jgi:Domain of unknown function (DUF5753)
MGRIRFKERDVADLLSLYGVIDSQQRQTLLDLARAASRPVWWHPYEDIIADWFTTLVALEDAASEISTYDAPRIPDLLQTMDYARVIARLEDPEASAGTIDMRLSMLQQRQERVRSSSVHLCALTDEAALRRPVGDIALMRGQRGPG